ncbi:GNAT family N-acetyltransferase [Micromonospora sp. MS34]|uniref:GNAT family N-acetyltransferase n=1 Tax=Micromonospora sp. MS34 TaxID=3385971 RepID=UPI0039A197FC
MLAVTEPLSTPRLLLRPFRPDDADDLYEMRTCPDVLRHLYWPAASRNEVREVINARLTMNTLAAENDYLVLAVERRDTGRMIGEVDLCWTSVEHRHAEFGAILHPAGQGHGYAREASEALLGLAFDRLGLHRVTARTDARNAAAVRGLRRLGLRQEGHLRQCVRFDGKWHDELIFAILAEEWAAGRRGTVVGAFGDGPNGEPGSPKGAQEA